jgi:hypothetical protein
MDFKLVSKNNIGTVVLLLLVIALSQARTFDFLIDSALGRSFLIVFILCLSYCHKILGIVGVLFVIIIFNTNMYSNMYSNMYYEGFETADGKTVTKPADPKVDTTSVDPTKLKENVKKQLSDAKTKLDASKAAINTAINTVKDTSTSTSTSTAAEGFDILGIENNIKRGKQSNSIPVNNFSRDSDSIAPYEGSSFLGSFSPF